MARDQKALTYRVRQLPPSINEAGVVRMLQDLLATEESTPTITVFSLAQSLVAPEETRSKDATVSIHPLPPALKNGQQWLFSALYSNTKYRIIVDLHFLDFTVLNDLSDDEHILDCIAISGLASHPFGSWQQRGDQQNFMWLRDAVPKDIPGIRTITYGYDTHLKDSKSFKSIYDIALTFAQRLTAVWLPSKPIVFIAHSLGGIILKQALVILARSSGQDLPISRMKGLLLFGVPNGGMATEELIAMVDEDPTKELVSNLSPGSQYLETLDSYFNSLQYTRKFHVMSFYETKTTNTIIRDIDGKWNRSGPRVIMVSRASATQICSRAPGEVHSIDEDHSAMVKFGPGDIHYTGVLDGLRKLLDRKTSSEYAELARKAASKRSATHETQTVNDNVEPSMPYEWPNLVAKQAKNHSSDDILNSLWLDVFDHRLKDISPHFQSTFEWIFNDESLGFVPWLLHGDGAYWVEGKPGAGKSTLLKFVYESQKTMELLENWNQPGTFIPAGFFFHHRGSRFQKSFEGMLRNLLYQVIKKVPSLYRDIPKSCLLAICENFNSAWNLGYLREALFSILRQRHTALKICVFIDALDELDGHLELISEFMTNLVHQKPGLAVCCKVFFSSRPRQIIRNRFGRYRHLKIHERTGKDIRIYTEGKLIESPQLISVLESCPESREQTARLVEVIFTQADGVFLWVKLAIEDITKALIQHDIQSINELEALLQKVPPGLDEFYESIIERIPADFKWEAYLTLEVILRAEETIRLGDIFNIVRCFGCKTVRECREQLSHPVPTETESKFLQSLQDNCGGLIELDFNADRIHLMHETVRAFMSRPGFEHLFFRQPILFRAQNGYTELAKFMLTKTQHYDARELDDPVCELDYSKFFSKGMEYCFKAESTTLTCQYEMVDEFRPLENPHNLRQYLSTRKSKMCFIPDSGISFAVIANLLLHMRRKLESISGDSAVNSNLEKPLLVCLSQAAAYADWMSPIKGPRQRIDYTSMAQLLLDKGADINAQYMGLTPFQWLFVTPWHKNPLFYFGNSVSSIGIARTLLENGQSPECNIWKPSMNIHARKRFTKPIHYSDTAMTTLLLEYNADVNARGSNGITALDLALGSRGILGPVADNAIHNICYYGNGPRIATLMLHGGLISRAGLIWLPECISSATLVGLDAQGLSHLPEVSRHSNFLTSNDFRVVPLLRMREKSLNFFRRPYYAVRFRIDMSKALYAMEKP